MSEQTYGCEVWRRDTYPQVQCGKPAAYWFVVRGLRVRACVDCTYRLRTDVPDAFSAESAIYPIDSASVGRE